MMRFRRWWARPMIVALLLAVSVGCGPQRAGGAATSGRYRDLLMRIGYRTEHRRPPRDDGRGHRAWAVLTASCQVKPEMAAGRG
jgi:hypothetical protein